MARSVANLVIETDTFFNWFTKTNEFLYALSTEVVTANATAGITGTVAAPRIGQLVGTFGANTLAVTTNLRGGNVTSSGLLTISSNTLFGGNTTANASFVNAQSNVFVNNSISQVNSQNIYLNGSNFVYVTGNTTFANVVIVQGNATFNSTLSYQNVCDEVVFSNTNLGSTTGSQLVVYTFDKSTYSSAKIIASVRAFSGNSSQTSEMLLAHDGASAYMTTYATVSSPSGTDLGDFSVDISGSDVRVKFNQTTANSSLKLISQQMR